MSVTAIETPRAAALAVLLLTLAAGGCAGTGAARPSPADGGTWTASLISHVNPPVSGNARIVPTEEADGWRAIVTVQGRPATSTVLGWRIFSGICGTTGSMIGSAVDYPAIQLQSDGRATVETVFDPDAFFGGVHSVRIYATPSATGGVVACGELRQS